MNTIVEAELADFIRNKAVKKLNIIQVDESKYQIVANLTWKEGDWYLVTTRKKTREWASLDRLARHIREKYNGAVPPISLLLKPLKKDDP
jgi:hypothetical protein